MKNLIKLFIVKKKAKIRSLFSKPSSAIFTVLMIVIYGSMFIPMFQSGDKQMIDSLDFFIYVVLVLGLSVIINVLTLLQKRQALFFEEDSYFMFVGPFSNKQILSYLIFETIFQSLLIGLLCAAFPVMILAQWTIIPWSYIAFAVLISALFTYFSIMILQYFYIRDMIKETKGKAKLIFASLLILSIVAFSAYNYFTSDFNLTQSFTNFVLSEEFYYVPVLGWAKASMISLFNAEWLTFFISTSLLVLANAIMTTMLINLKGYFYERAMIDATDFSEYYKRAMAGETTKKNQKMHDGTVKYKKFAGAIHSKNLLVLIKTRSFMNSQDIMSLVFVAIFCFFVKPNYTVYYGVIIFYLMNSVSGSTLIDDLKSNYIYLIPDKPLRKLFNVLIIPIVKTIIYSGIMALVGFILLDMPVKDFIIGTLLIWSFVFVFYTGAIVSIRLLKSRSNKMMEMTMRMLVITLICLPSAGIAWLLYEVTGNLNDSINIIVPCLLIFNIVLSAIIMIICSPMMNGNAYAAE